MKSTKKFHNGMWLGERIRVLYRIDNVIYEVGILESRLPELEKDSKIEILKIEPFILGEGFTEEDRKECLTQLPRCA